MRITAEYERKMDGILNEALARFATEGIAEFKTEYGIFRIVSLESVPENESWILTKDGTLIVKLRRS